MRANPEYDFFLDLESAWNPAVWNPEAKYLRNPESKHCQKHKASGIPGWRCGNQIPSRLPHMGQQSSLVPICKYGKCSAHTPTYSSNHINPFIIKYIPTFWKNS
jgi:hypothetical protein